jgi:membrane protease subunit HflC
MKKTIIIGILLLLVVVAVNSAYLINEGQQGLVFQFGEPMREVRDPGLYFKLPFVQNVVLLEKRVLGTEPLSAEYLTLDKKRLLVDHVSRWQITDP